MKITKQDLYLIITTLLFSLYPIIALIAANLNEMPFYDTYRSILASAVLGIILLGLFLLLMRDTKKASIATIFSLLLFHTYGHIYSLLQGITGLPAVLSRHRFLVPVWIIAFLLVLFLIWRREVSFSLANSLSIIAILLLVYPIIEITVFITRQNTFQSHTAALQGQWDNSDSESDQELPDIYYIILDAYSRDDFLLTHYDYDNSAFRKFLEDQGFYIANCSQSNYGHTRMSLSSSLNLNYFEAYYDVKIEGQIAKNPRLNDYIYHSEARKFLEAHGYRMIAFETGHNFSEVKDAALYLSPETGKPRTSLFGRRVNGFEVVFIRSTALLAVSATSPKIAEVLLPNLNIPNLTQRERVLYVLETLPQLAELSGPKFIFAHIVSPHHPFVFGPNGEVVPSQPHYAVGYKNQITYIDARMQEVVAEILANSKRPPIIIIQGDHGAVWDPDKPQNASMAILNAYYLPDGDAQDIIYPEITPINSFRIVFNQYLDADYELLEDRSLFSTFQAPHDYTVIDDTREGCPP